MFFLVKCGHIFTVRTPCSALPKWEQKQTFYFAGIIVVCVLFLGLSVCPYFRGSPWRGQNSREAFSSSGTLPFPFFLENKHNMATYQDREGARTTLLHLPPCSNHLEVKPHTWSFVLFTVGTSPCFRKGQRPSDWPLPKHDFKEQHWVQTDPIKANNTASQLCLHLWQLFPLLAMETHLQGVGFLVVAKEREGADAGFTLALFLIRCMNQVSSGPVSLEKTLWLI